MIIEIGCPKGGTGKSTIATNIAAHLATMGREVLLVDVDPQASAYNWAQRRQTVEDVPPITAVMAHQDTYKAISDLAGRFDDTIIDSGGHASNAMKSAMMAAQMVITPFQPSQADLETFPTLLQMLEDVRIINTNLLARAVLSRSPTNPVIKETQEAKAALAQFDTELPLARQVIRDRIAYRDAFRAGLGVVELNNNKATAEIQLLVDEIIKELNNAEQ